MKDLKDILDLIVPMVKEFLEYLRDRKLRELRLELKQAKTPEEKREAARKFANHKYGAD